MQTSIGTRFPQQTLDCQPSFECLYQCNVCSLVIFLYPHHQCPRSSLSPKTSKLGKSVDYSIFRDTDLILIPPLATHNDTQMTIMIQERPEDKRQPPTDNPLASGGTEASLRSPSVDDVFVVRHDLNRFVPLELADMILENAMYWPKVSASRTERKAVVAWYGTSKSNTAVYYVVTPPISYRDIQNGQIRVRKVRFSLESHGRIWLGNISDRGECFL
jgi:hypothetical protein